MKKNIDFFADSIILLIVSLGLNYRIVRSFILTHVYRRLDFTGNAQIIQITLASLLFLIAIVCTIKAIKNKEKGVDSLFNKMVVVCFIFYIMITISSFIFVRSQEEKVAMQMKNEIESMSISPENYSKNQKTKQQQMLNNALLQVEYATNDKYYNRKQAIIKQVENSGTLDRYLSIIVLDNSLAGIEWEYYRIYIYFAAAGLYGAIRYACNEYNRKKLEDLLD